MASSGRSRRKRVRGAIDQLASGALRVRVYAGKDPITHRNHYLSEVVPASTNAAREAERIRTRLVNQVDERRHPRTNATVSQLLDRHFELLNVDRKTQRGYRGLADKHVKPLLGAQKAGRIDGEIIDSLYSELRRCRLHCDGKPFTEHRTRYDHACDRRCGAHVCRGLQANTIRQAHYLLSGAYKSATRWGWVYVNPLEQVDAPPPARANPRPPSTEEAARLLNQAWRNSVDWGVQVWLSMVTGSRRGEMCAIRWRHVDLNDGHVLHLASAIAQLGGELWEKDTKTHQERRIVLDDDTVELLSDHWARCVARAEALGFELSQDAFVFSPDPDGMRPLRPDSVTQRYGRLAKRLGVDTHLHSLRHYSATELIAAGVDIRTVVGRLGHGGGGSTTLRVYAAWVSEADQRAASSWVKHMPARPQVVEPSERAKTDPGSPFEQIAAEIRRDILDGQLADGSDAPTLKELMVTYGVAAGTAHRAIGLLKEWGCVIGGGRGRRSRISRSGGEATDAASSRPVAEEPSGETLLELRLLHLGTSVRTLTAAADPNDPAHLRRLLSSAARRHGGADADVGDYELEVRRLGSSTLLSTFVAL